MIVLDLSILNQKGTPMFNSDTFANRPAFGIVGRIFISIDTAAIYRDTGTAWDLIADGGSSSTNIYNSNGTLSANRVVSDGGFGLSFTPTTHIGTAAIGGGGNGKLIVGSSTADNGIQVFGANAPSIRIDNAQSGGTQRFVFGLATATNNFIQGATAGQFCISTQSAGNMLFGMWQTTNASEVMRITTANNLIINSSTDSGERLQITGTSKFTGTINGAGIILSSGINIASDIFWTNNTGFGLKAQDGTRYLSYTTSGGTVLGSTGSAKTIIQGNGGNVLIGTTTDAGQRLQVDGNVAITGSYSGVSAFLTTTVSANVGKFGAAGNNAFLEVAGASGEVFRADAALGAYRIIANQTKVLISGQLNLVGLPTSPAGLVTGDVYNNLGILTIV